jgi:hypothetical protein
MKRDADSSRYAPSPNLHKLRELLRRGGWKAKGDTMVLAWGSFGTRGGTGW